VILAALRVADAVNVGHVRPRHLSRRAHVRFRRRDFARLVQSENLFRHRAFTDADRAV
jgi:hypothetical protein